MNNDNNEGHELNLDISIYGEPLDFVQLCKEYLKEWEYVGESMGHEIFKKNKVSIHIVNFGDNSWCSSNVNTDGKCGEGSIDYVKGMLFDFRRDVLENIPYDVACELYEHIKE
ncbi:hypothetical protein [Neisseria sp. Ec49-e6-T10]|uniref:hypothetical protein n=1 Tax=Neisseria sp. Ec49-e6-T10 TaxID=3140744 RepID=UPI003EBA9895